LEAYKSAGKSELEIGASFPSSIQNDTVTTYRLLQNYGFVNKENTLNISSCSLNLLD